jgi:4'-phosphopantetheinyl transferase
MPSNVPTLAPKTVDLWYVDLAKGWMGVDEPWGLLAADERDRAMRFVRLCDRNHFTLARALLRQFLGHYLHCPPAQITFSYTPQGKPLLANPHPQTIAFNLAHSQSIALFGFAELPAPSQPLLGVDIEQIRPMSEPEKLAQRFFAPSEYQALMQVPSEQRLTQFFRYWTGKEAYLKATGTGLSYGLDQVVLKPVENTVTLALTLPASATPAAQQWSVQQVIPHPEAIAAVAVAQTPCQFRYWQYGKPLASATLEHLQPTNPS